MMKPLILFALLNINFNIKRTFMSSQLNTEYHRQESFVFCGAACAQMIVHQIDLSYPDQTDINDYIQAHDSGEEGWAADPTGLTAAIIEYDRRSNFTYEIFSETPPSSDIN